MITDFRLGDLVRLRKPHPCGGDTWAVVRLGADIGLCCATCQRRVLLERRLLERRMKAFVSRGPTTSLVEGRPVGSGKPLEG